MTSTQGNFDFETFVTITSHGDDIIKQLRQEIIKSNAEKATECSEALVKLVDDLSDVVESFYAIIEDFSDGEGDDVDDEYLPEPRFKPDPRYTEAFIASLPERFRAQLLEQIANAPSCGKHALTAKASLKKTPVVSQPEELSVKKQRKPRAPKVVKDGEVTEKKTRKRKVAPADLKEPTVVVEPAAEIPQPAEVTQDVLPSL